MKYHVSLLGYRKLIPRFSSSFCKNLGWVGVFYFLFFSRVLTHAYSDVKYNLRFGHANLNMCLENMDAKLEIYRELTVKHNKMTSLLIWLVFIYILKTVKI